MSFKFIRNLMILAVTLGFVSCAAFKPKLDSQRAQKVKKLVVLSFEIHQQQPKDALGMSRLNEMKVQRAESPELLSMAQQMYTFLNAKITNKTNWKVMSYQKLIENSEYSKLYNKKMSGVRRVSITTENTEVIHPKGVLDNVNFRSLSYLEKVKLAKSLGADAFAEFIAYQSIDQGFSLGNLTGEASFSLKNRSNLLVYSFDSEEPLWRVQNIDGTETEKSGDMKEKVSVLEKLSRLGVDSAKTSIEKLVGYYSL